MIQIVVVARQGMPVGQPLSAEFGPSGGTVGRAPTNTLVLDDPERTVSRVHAQVLCRNGHYFIVDRGSNPLLINGRALGSGNEAPLAQGDRLVIGGFELVVHAQAADAAAPAPGLLSGHAPTAAAAGGASFGDDDPFADLLAGLGSPAPAAPAPAPARSAAGAADSLLFPNPMEAAAGRSAAAIDPFADLLAPGSHGAAPARAPAALDDFSDLGAPVAGKAASIDELFGGMGGGGGIGGDPLALSPLADPLLQPNTAAQADPLAALQGGARPTAAPRSDHLPVGQFGYVPPRALTPQAMPPAAPPVATPAPPPAAAMAFDDETGLPIAPAAMPADDDPFADLLPPSASPAAAAVVATPPAAPPAPRPAPAPVVAPVAAAVPAPPVQRTAPAGAALAASDAELLAAFLRGLGSLHQPPEALTPGLMERVGQMLRASTEGTLQLLLTRQEFKREVRAEVTMIASQANNPLKFSPTVEVALAHLLGPGVRGFMPPEAAMKDAYDDLRSHQFGVMVGMRAALAHVIARFSPDELEKKIAARSALDALFAANRKAKLWDQFVALYGGIATEAEDDFHSLFGKAFLQAYEEQMARLKSADR